MAHRRRALLRVLRRSAPVARTELARATGISKPGVSRLVTALIDEGLVRETGREDPQRQGGKPRVLLALDPSAMSAVACVVRPGEVVAALGAYDGSVRSRSRIRFGLTETPSDVLGHVARAVGDVRESEPSGRPLVGVGIGVPGTVDSRGRVSMGVMPGWFGVPVAERLTRALGCPVSVDNAARLDTLAEMWFSATGLLDSVVVVNFADGIGAGVVVHGRLWRGAHAFAGEIGHLQLGRPGVVCRCGQTSCWENTFGLQPFVARLRLVPAMRRESEEPDDEVVLSAAGARARSDEALDAVLADEAAGIATGLCALVMSIDPQLIVLRGGIERLGVGFLERVRTEVAERLTLFRGVHPSIVFSELGANSDVLGALSLVLRDEWGLAPL